MSEITVLLPLYDECDEYIIDSIESILNQSFTDLHLMIRLDQPKNERIEQLINKYILMDCRIDFSVNDKNYGLAVTLNRMIDCVDTPYIARMDGDDISCIDRLETQYKFMQENPDVDLCGSNIIYIDNNGFETHRKGRLPQENIDIAKTLRFIDVFCHPTFFAKTAVMKKYKYRDLQYSQDYDLVCRMIEQGCHLTNINQYLLRYRSSKNSDVKIMKQRIISGVIQKHYIQKNLNDTDICVIVDNDLKNISDKKISRYGKATRNYDIGILALKKKSFLKGVLKISESFFQSKYMMQNIFRAFIFRVILFRTSGS